MMLLTLAKFTIRILPKLCSLTIAKQCHAHGVFGVKDLMQQEKTNQFTLSQVTAQDHSMAVDIIKRYYLREHVLVQARNMDLSNDRALDEYIVNLLKQGNSFYARADDDGSVAGLSVSYASSPVDPKNLRNYAYFRQDANTKEFLYFTAKLQETPNLWDVYKQPKVFEIKMIAVLPEYRRQGLAMLLAEKSKEQAFKQGFKVIRMDCINPYDYKIAERCMLQCIVKFPLHKVRGDTAPFIKQCSEHNRCVRVYVHLLGYRGDKDRELIKQKQSELESLIE